MGSTSTRDLADPLVLTAVAPVPLTAGAAAHAQAFKQGAAFCWASFLNQLTYLLHGVPVDQGLSQTQVLDRAQHLVPPQLRRRMVFFLDSIHMQSSGLVSATW